MPTKRLSGAAIELIDLRKTYAGGKQALRGVSLTIPRGSTFGLLGPNGAGKSTLINILGGLVRKSGGEALILGIDAADRSARYAIGVVPQELTLDPYFPARAALELQAGLFGIPKRARRSDELLAALGLADEADQPARSLSGGMRRRLMVAKALVHGPPVLVLDEPTAGVDVELRQRLWDYVRQLNRAGTTVLLTTHYLHEAEELCDRIAVLVDGGIVACDTTEALLRGVKDKALEVELEVAASELPPQLAAFDAVLTAPRRILIRYGHEAAAIGYILSAVQSAGLCISDIRTIQPRLEDAFLTLIRQKGAGGVPPKVAEPGGKKGAKTSGSM